ncbi:hypothetical protein [Aurantivibrio plasticivorans]
MANSPIPLLEFVEGCSDCGLRTASLPLPLPSLGDDFDWLVRDYDGFRLFMMEELSARFPERRRWTPADMEVVIVEALSVVLDQLSDMLDRSHAEAFLETARQPQSVRRLLSLIGYDAIALADPKAKIPDVIPSIVETEVDMRTRLLAFHTGVERYEPEYQFVIAQLTATQQTRLQNFISDPHASTLADLTATQAFLDKAPELVQRIQHDALHQYWYLYPRAMDAARMAGPRAVHTQRRMVTTADYADRLADHPLVLFAESYSRWTGSWSTVQVACMLFSAIELDTAINESTLGGPNVLASLQAQVNEFHRQRNLPEINWVAEPTSRTVLRTYIDAYRMSGQEVFVSDAEKIGINISLSIRISSHYFQSEVQQAVFHTLGSQLGGFFEPGRLRFGQDLYASDIVEIIMALDGIEAVCLNRFKRVGKRFTDQSDSGRIELAGYQVAVCDNVASNPAMGILRLVVHGGQRG